MPDVGYDNYVRGDAVIVPPIDEKHWPAPDDHYGKPVYFMWFDLTHVEGDETVAVVDGQLTVVGTNSGHTIVEWAFDDTVRGDFDGEMKALFDWARQHGSRITGKFWRDGEESGDFQRWRFEGDQFYDEHPQIVWPNGDTGQGA